MITRHKYKNIEWLDLESPTEVEILPIALEFHLNSLIVNELSRPSERTRVDSYDNLMYLTLHFPRYKHTKNKETLQEIDFVIGKNFIITSHYEPVDMFFGLSQILETKLILDKSEGEENSGFIFFHITKRLYENLEHELEHINQDLALAEKEIFSGNEHEVVQVLSKINKALIDFRYPLRLHQEILTSLDSKKEKVFGIKCGHYTEIIIGEYKKVWSMAESNKELLMDLRNTNDSLLSAKTNDIMKRLTIMSFLTFPLTLMTGIFGMNTAKTPLVGLENGFWIILGIMGTITLSMITLFISKRWI